MSALDSLEKKLDELFVKQMPALPVGLKKWLVKYLPWINLVLGVLTAFAALGLWRAAHTVNELVDYANQLSAAYGGPTNQVADLSVFFWVALAVLVVEAVLYIAAFPGMRDKKKSGWNLLFYALLINLAYGFFVMFTNYGSVGSFIGAIIGTAIGGYFLFQIRSSYTKSAPARAAKAKK